MDYSLLIFIIYLITELVEINLTLSITLKGILEKHYKYYKKSIFLFLLMQPTYIFAIFILIYTNFSIASIILLIIKTIDIYTKIVLIDKVFTKNDIDDYLYAMINTKLDIFLPFLNILIYPPLVYFAIF